MLDEFIYGSVERISPEAPVPVVKVARDLCRLGGGANVAANLTSLGAKVELCGVVGKDEGSAKIRDLCNEIGIGTRGLISVAKRDTTLKTRIIAHHQQVVRFDREHNSPIPKPVLTRLFGKLDELMTPGSAIIVSDYGKGVVGKTCD